MLCTLTGHWKVILLSQPVTGLKTVIIIAYLCNRLFGYATFELCLHIILKKAQLEQ